MKSDVDWKRPAMNYGWAKGATALAMVALLAGPLAACDRAPAAPDETAAENLRAAADKM